MRALSSLTEQQREQLVALFESGIARSAAANQTNLSRNAAGRLEHRWKLHGRLCLVEKATKQTYSFETKKEVVDRFLAGETVMELAAEFHLSSDQLVSSWVRGWRRRGDDALRPKPKGRPKGSVKPSVLTEEDRLRRQVARLEAENGVCCRFG